MIYDPPTLSDQHLEVIEKLSGLRNQLRYVIQSQPSRWTGVLRRMTFARAIQASNTIEGYNVTREDALDAADEEPPEEKSESWNALTGYRGAMTYILQLADDPHFTYNEGTLRSLHFMMLSYDISKHPGRWRPGHIYVRREPEGRIVYEGPQVDLVPELISELVTDLNEHQDLPAIIRAAMAHLNLVMIHPFSDGNGRMARALQTMVLSREGIVDRTFCSIEEYLGRNTEDYYKVLAEVGQGSWHPQNNALPWVEYCMVAHFRQAETLIRRLSEMGKLWGEIEAEVTKRGMNERVIVPLVNMAMGQTMRNSRYQKQAEVSVEVASKDLRALANAGLIMPHGERRGRYYTAGEWLRAKRRETREDKVISNPFSSERQVIPKSQRNEEPYLPGLSPQSDS